MQKRTIAFSIFSLFFSFFLYMTFKVYTGQSIPFDHTVQNALKVNPGEDFHEAASIITWLGSGKFLLPAVIILSLVFLFQNGMRSYAWKIGLVSLSGYGLVYLVKHLVQRTRPGFAEDDASVYSYPSGHTFTGMIFFGLLVYFAVRYMNGPLRWIIIILSFLLTIAVGSSRILLGVHYPTDVLASWLLGIMWFMLAGWFLEMRWKRKTNNGR